MSGNTCRRHPPARNQCPRTFNDGTPLYGDKSHSYGRLLTGGASVFVPDDELGWEVSG